jgi:hypothetical protein
MATCPRCLGPLTDDHRCPVRRRLHRTAVRSAAVLAGGMVAVGVTVIVSPEASATLPALAFALGGSIGFLVGEAFRA